RAAANSGAVRLRRLRHEERGQRETERRQRPWHRDSLPRAPPEVQRSESVVQSELHLARAVEGVADAAERGGVDVEARVGSAGQVAESVIRAGIKTRMIQRIGGLESKLDGSAFGNLR